MNTLVLCSGGLKSLVLVGVQFREDLKAPKLLFFQRGRCNDVHRYHAVREIARYYKTTARTEGLVDFDLPPNSLYDLTYLLLKALPIAREEECQRICIGWTIENWSFTSYRNANAIGQYLSILSNYLTAVQCTVSPIQIDLPFYLLDAQKTVYLGKSFNVPWSLTWSCTVPGSKIHCGKCPSCIRRQRLLRLIGVNDQTIYQHLLAEPNENGNNE